MSVDLLEESSVPSPARNRSAEHANYREDWETPPEVFRYLDRRYRFVCDLAASHENAKCERYNSREAWPNPLDAQWPRHGWCWLNPPYGEAIIPFVTRCARETKRHIVALLPANTDAGWFHEFVLRRPHAHVTWVRGRIQFLLGGKRSDSGNTTGSVIVQYGGARILPRTISVGELMRDERQIDIEEVIG